MQVYNNRILGSVTLSKFTTFEDENYALDDVAFSLLYKNNEGSFVNTLWNYITGNVWLRNGWGF